MLKTSIRLLAVLGLLFSATAASAQTIIPSNQYFPGTIHGYNPAKALNWTIEMPNRAQFIFSGNGSEWHRGRVEIEGPNVLCFVANDLNAMPRFCRSVRRDANGMYWVDPNGNRQGDVVALNPLNRPNNSGSNNNSSNNNSGGVSNPQVNPALPGEYGLTDYVLNEVALAHRRWCRRNANGADRCFPVLSSIADSEVMILNVELPNRELRVEYAYVNGWYQRNQQGQVCDVVEMTTPRRLNAGVEALLKIADFDCTNESIALDVGAMLPTDLVFRLPSGRRLDSVARAAGLVQ